MTEQTELIESTKKIKSVKSILTKKFLEQMKVKIPNLTYRVNDDVVEFVHNYTKWTSEFTNVYVPVYVTEEPFNRVNHYVMTFRNVKDNSMAKIVLSMESNNIVKETFNNKSFPYSKEDVAEREKNRMKKFWQGDYKEKHNLRRQQINTDKIIAELEGKLKLSKSLLTRYEMLINLSTNEQGKSELQKAVDKLKKNIAYYEKHIKSTKAKKKDLKQC